ncbi:hypothetical protein R3P38DRAFT_2767651 [Favolaschia claudopus]|uniref:Uncharacterized protein n=1 Tax=Favolaschia claudopus TaxID=2862362 RepID=A0AAW0CSG5_9AGAR
MKPMGSQLVDVGSELENVTFEVGCAFTREITSRGDLFEVREVGAGSLDCAEGWVVTLEGAVEGAASGKLEISASTALPAAQHPTRVPCACSSSPWDARDRVSIQLLTVQMAVETLREVDNDKRLFLTCKTVGRNIRYYDAIVPQHQYPAIYAAGANKNLSSGVEMRSVFSVSVFSVSERGTLSVVLYSLQLVPRESLVILTPSARNCEKYWCLVNFWRELCSEFANRGAAGELGYAARWSARESGELYVIVHNDEFRFVPDWAIQPQIHGTQSSSRNVVPSRIKNSLSSPPWLLAVDTPSDPAEVVSWADEKTLRRDTNTLKNRKWAWEELEGGYNSPKKLSGIQQLSQLQQQQLGSQQASKHAGSISQPSHIFKRAAVTERESFRRHTYTATEDQISQNHLGKLGPVNSRRGMNSLPVWTPDEYFVCVRNLVA